MCEVPGLPFPAYNPPTLKRLSADGAFGLAGLIDVETTGLNPHIDEIVEFAIILFAFDRVKSTIIGVVDEYVGLREPKRKIPPQATRIHGITDADVAGRQLDGNKIKQLIEQAEFLVAHNAAFDRGFVTRLFPMAQLKLWLCSMRHVDWYGRGYRSRALQALLRAHGIQVAQAHRGEADVKAALMLLAQRDASGTPYFADLLRQYDAALHRASAHGTPV